MVLNSRESTERAVVDAARRVEHLAAIVEQSADAIMATDREGVITSWNSAAERLYGYAPCEMVGRSIFTLLPDEDAETGRTAIERILAGDEVHARETVQRRKDGSTVPVLTSASPLRDKSGAIIGLATFSMDVTDRVRARERAEQLQDRVNESQRLEAVGQLAGRIAHDFNNLLAVILNYSGFVKDELPDDHPARDDINEVRRAGERAAALTRQLLIFSRRETVKPALLDLNVAVQDAEKLLRPTIGEHIDLTVDLAEGLWPVLADQGRIEQALVNLAVNARDAMPDGGRLTIETSNIEFDEASIGIRGDLSPGRYVRLQVGDTGCGMPPEVAERAFDPFYTTKPKGQGTGLGLATVYGIVHEAGGSIRIYSEAGQGTAIKAYLPATAEVTLSPERAEPCLPAGSGQTILVVGDEEAVRDATRRILEANGYSALTASRGAEALRACEQGAQIDLLLTDVVMPEMSGKELADRAAVSIRDLKVLYMSGYTDQQISFDCGRLIEKPFNTETLLCAVRDALESAEPESSFAGGEGS